MPAITMKVMMNMISISYSRNFGKSACTYRSENYDVSTYIEDLINKLKKVVDFCNRNDIYLSVCGELASIEDIALKFYQIGIKNLSVSPGCIGTLNGTYTKFMGEK